MLPSVDDTDGVFFPVRSGRMRISKLTIVDAFGQSVDLPVDTINRSVKSLANTESSLLRRSWSCIPVESDPKSPDIALSPRFVEPMRLCFKWEKASQDAKEPHPVCGWIVPNQLEKSLAIFDADGKSLGVLQRMLTTSSHTESHHLYYWVNVPESKNTDISVLINDTPEKIEQQLQGSISNNHLRYFCAYVLCLTSSNAINFMNLIDKVIASTDQRVPEEDPGVSVLVGRPFALVRASIRFEIPGLPACRPELKDTMLTDGYENMKLKDLLSTDGYDKVRWPLRLGDQNAPNDGLIGIFKCDTKNEDEYTSTGEFYSTWGLDDNFKQDFVIDCVNPFQISMLIDPQARVHATTGILPRTFIELSPAEQAGAKSAREFFFQTAPVLGIVSTADKASIQQKHLTPEMPIPSDDYGEWSWAYRPDVTGWMVDPNIVEATDHASLNNIFHRFFF